MSDYKLVTPEYPNKDDMLQVKTLIITDGATSETPKEECERMTWRFNDHGINLVYRHSRDIFDINKLWHEMVMFDYGGMMGGYGTPTSFRPLMSWAENHPGKLLIVYTWFTSMYWDDEFYEEEDLDNVLFFDPSREGRTIALVERKKHEENIAEKIKQYYGT